MIREHIQSNEDRGKMRELARHMGKNNFFKLFVGQYQKGLIKALEEGQDDQPKAKKPGDTS